jgi:hypothetical protein
MLIYTRKIPRKNVEKDRINGLRHSTDTKVIARGSCWGLVLKCYELRTRQHKMLNINALRPLKHYFPKDLMNSGRRP